MPDPKCPNCGKEMRIYADKGRPYYHCLICMQKSAPAPPPIMIPLDLAQEAVRILRESDAEDKEYPTVDEMMTTCSQCGAKTNRPYVKPFCPKCWEQLNKAPAPPLEPKKRRHKTCPKCGARADLVVSDHPLKTSFECIECGYEIADPLPAPKTITSQEAYKMAQNDLKQHEKEWNEYVEGESPPTHTNKNPPELYHICQECNQEFLLQHGQTLRETVHTIENCPHCKKQNNIWIRIVWRTSTQHEYQSFCMCKKCKEERLKMSKEIWEKLKRIQNAEQDQPLLYGMLKSKFGKDD